MPLKNLSAYRDKIIKLLAAQGVDAEVIYIFSETGLLVSEANADRLSEEQLEVVGRATVEYRLLLERMAATKQ